MTSPISNPPQQLGSPLASGQVASPTQSGSPLLSRRTIRDPSTQIMAEKVPLIVLNDNKPPLAGPETVDLDDDREVVTHPYPGVDDGFFNGDKPTNGGVPEEDDTEIPVITSRAGPEGGSENPDDVDGVIKPVPGSTNNIPGRLFPFSPGFGPDLETGSVFPGESIPDLNVYQHKKTLAQGMMDLALFSANANQLRYVLETFNMHPYYYPSLILLSISLILQVAVGVGLIWNATYNVKDEKHLCIANKINNFTIIAIFLVTVVNVFISAFGVANPPSS